MFQQKCSKFADAKVSAINRFYYTYVVIVYFSYDSVVHKHIIVVTTKVSLIAATV